MAGKEEERPPIIARIFGGATRARIILMAAVVVVFFGGAIALWQIYGPAVTAGQSAKFQISPQGVSMPPQPEWVKADVKQQVFRDAGWNSQPPSALDPELTVKIAQAFELHTWVAKVTRVRKKHPAQVEVELTYRRPVAMVEVDYQGQAGLLPIDSEGVLLPPDDFSADQAREFPRVVADYSSPGGPVGTPWGDRRVWGGAKIVGVLQPKWKLWNLYRVVAEQPPGRRLRGEEPTFEVTTRDGGRILWGHAPGQEIRGEPTAAAKLKQLGAELAAAAGSGAPLVIDLRSRPRGEDGVTVGRQPGRPGVR